MDPAQLKYAKSHEWVSIEGGTATIGITKFAVELLSDLVFVDLPPVGKLLTVGATLGEVESVKAVSDVYSPVAGEVIAVNTELPDHLDWLSQDSFGKGWIAKVKLSDPSSVSGLLDLAAYEAHCQSERH